MVNNTLTVTRYLLIIFFLTSLVQISKANDSQNSNEQNNDFGLHLNLGLGASHFGPTFRVGAAYSNNQNLFSVRYIMADEYRFNVEGHYDEPPRRLRELSILYGRYRRDNYVVMSASVGLGYIVGMDRGEELVGQVYPQKELSTLGLSLEGKFIFTPFKSFGIGISAYGNINSQKSYGGGMIEIILGK